MPSKRNDALANGFYIVAPTLASSAADFLRKGRGKHRSQDLILFSILLMIGRCQGLVLDNTGRWYTS